MYTYIYIQTCIYIYQYDSIILNPRLTSRKASVGIHEDLEHHSTSLVIIRLVTLRFVPSVASQQLCGEDPPLLQDSERDSRWAAVIRPRVLVHGLFLKDPIIKHHSSVTFHVLTHFDA